MSTPFNRKVSLQCCKVVVKCCGISTYALRGGPASPQVLCGQGFMSIPDHHSTHERKRLVTLLHEPFVILLEHVVRTILVNAILSDDGSPTPIIKGVRSVLMNPHYIGTVQHDTDAAIMQNLGVGVISHLTTMLVSLTTNHTNRFGVSH